MPRRFFVPNLGASGPVRLSGEESRHLARVLRGEVGDIVFVFDGRGNEAMARIDSIGKDDVELSVLERYVADSASAGQVQLAVAVPKGDRFAWLVEKATEVGVDRLIPLITRRSVVEPGAGKLDRMRRSIIEASKQCGRSRLMELADTTPFEQALAGRSPGAMVLIADPGGAPWLDFLRIGADSQRDLLLIVGPEGGLTDEELATARSAGGRCVSLGPHILRIETAAILLAGMILCTRSGDGAAGESSRTAERRSIDQAE